MKRVSLCGFYGKGNFGDDLMALYLPRVFKESGELYTFLYSDCREPHVQDGRDGSFVNAEVLVVGGGGIVTPKFWLFSSENLERISNMDKVAFVNVNVTPDIKEDPMFCRWLRNLQARWWVRDYLSQEILSEIGIASTILPDVAMLREVTFEEHTPSDKRIMSVFLNGHAFAPMFSDDPIASRGTDYGARVIAGFLDWMTTFGWEINFYPCHGYGRDDDRIIAGYVKRLMTAPAVWHTRRFEVGEIVRTIVDSDLVLSMRYHPTVVALSARTPVVDITHHDKNRALIRYMDGMLDEDVANTDLLGITPEKLIKCAQCAEAHQPSKIAEHAEVHWNQFSVDFAEFINE